MKTYQELKLEFKKVNDDEIIKIFQDFTQYSNEWTYLQKESNEHIKETGNPSCILSLDDNYHKPLFLITKRKDKLYSIVHIYSFQYSYTMLERNVLMRQFEKDFKHFIGYGNYTDISIKLSKEDIGLDEIISSPKAREYFQRYLNRLPINKHHNDMERLYLFICAASRYCKKSINTDLIEQYLVEELKWTQEDAKWCRSRIDVGLEILKVNKQFDSYYI